MLMLSIPKEFEEIPIYDLQTTTFTIPLEYSYFLLVNTVSSDRKSNFYPGVIKALSKNTPPHTGTRFLANKRRFK